MVNTSNFINSRPLKKGWLFFFKIFIALACFVPLASYAHPSPNSLVFLDVSPSRVGLEVKLPVPELELAFGQNISKDPETLVDRLGPQLQEYLLSHVHAYATKGHPWQVKIVGLKMSKGTYVDTNIRYWEVDAEMLLLPQRGEGTRKFFLDYDVIMHQVINHVAFVSIRNDWETGKVHIDSTEASVIAWNLKDNIIPPLEVNLDKGSWWKGFKAMVNLGMEHIKGGSDHLLFLLVLLLPAPLVIKGRNWNGFGGIKYSLKGILKIVTAFTIGHSTTLLLATLGLVKLPTQPVEILIAFSILVSAIHAIFPIFPKKEMYVAAGFGLIHGLAFASVLSNLNLSAGTLALSALGFNLGIEMMQLFIVVLIIPWLIILSERNIYKYFRVGGAAFAGIAALAWMVQRYLQKPNELSTLVDHLVQHGEWLVIGLAFVAIANYFFTSERTHRSI